MDTTLISITSSERQMLADLSEAIDVRTDLGDGDAAERAFWVAASDLVSRLSAASAA